MTSVCYCICIQSLWFLNQLMRQGAKCIAVHSCVDRIEQAYSQTALHWNLLNQVRMVWFGLTVLKVLFRQAKCWTLVSVQIAAEVLLSIKLYLGMDNECTTCSAWDH